MEESKILEILAKEAQDVGVRITTYLALGERVLTIGLGFVTLLGTLVAINDRTYVLMAAPFTLCLILSYVVYLNTEAVALGGYKAAVELALNERTGINLITWESKVAKLRHRDISTIGIRVMSASLVLLSIILAVWRAFQTAKPGEWGHEYSTAIIIGTIFFTTFGVIVTLLAIHAQSRTHSRIADITEQSIGKRAKLRTPEFEASSDSAWQILSEQRNSTHTENSRRNKETLGRGDA